MPNMAKVDLVGHLGRDAEMKHTPQGQAVLEWSMAVSTKRGGNESTNWFRCSLWGKRAESLASHLTKGTALFVTGRLTARDYETKDGKSGYSLEVNVNELEFLGGKSGGGEPEELPRRSSSPSLDKDDDIPF